MTTWRWGPRRPRPDRTRDRGLPLPRDRRRRGEAGPGPGPGDDQDQWPAHGRDRDRTGPSGFAAIARRAGGDPPDAFPGLSLAGAEVAAESSPGLVQKLGVTSYPAVLVYRPGGNSLALVAHRSGESDAYVIYRVAPHGGVPGNVHCRRRCDDPPHEPFPRHGTVPAADAGTRRVGPRAGPDGWAWIRPAPTVPASRPADPPMAPLRRRPLRWRRLWRPSAHGAPSTPRWACR